MRALLLAVLVMAPLSAGAAESDDVVQKAKQFFDGGRRAYEAGQFKAAITAFSESYRLSPRAATVFSLAQAYRLYYFQEKDATSLKRAIDLYRQYLVEEPQGARRGDSAEFLAAIEPIWARMEEKERRGVEQRREAALETQLMISSSVSGASATIDGGAAVSLPAVLAVRPGAHKIRTEAPGYLAEELEATALEGRVIMVEARLTAKPAIVVVKAPEGIDVSVGGRPIGETPLLGPLSLPAGRHFLSFTERGHYPMTKEIEVERGQETAVEVELDTTGQRTLAYAFWAGSVALIGGGVATTFIALGAENEAQRIEAIPETLARTITAAEAIHHDKEIVRRDRWAIATGVVFGTALGAAATGTILYFFDLPRVTLPTVGAVDIVPSVGPSGGQISGRF